MKIKLLNILILSIVSSITATAQNDVVVVSDSNSTERFELPDGMSVTEEELLREYTNRTNLSAGSSATRTTSYNDQILIDRLSRIPTIIDMPLNDITRKFIDTYSNRMKRSVSVMLGASNFYMPLFEEALERYNLPLELKYLPVIESGLRPGVTSRAGAAGLWQFMIASGKQYGLEVNTLVDERRDPIKSSDAAARYLSDLYKMFNDWSLAIAAYNCGPYNVQKALLRAGGSKSLTFWDVYNYLPNETRGYVPAFIAATYIMNFYCEHGITPMDAVLPAESDTIVVAHDAKLVNIASICNVTIDELRSLNPQYRRDIVPQNYAVRLPAQAIESFITKEDMIYGGRISSTTNDNNSSSNNNSSSSENENTENSEVSVMPLNTSELAASDNSDTSESTESVVTATTTNNNSWYSRSGSQNTRNTQSSRSSRRNTRSSRQNTTKSVSVRSGDTLSKIAAQNGTTVEKLRKMNGIKGSTIRPGQKIRVK